MTVQSAADRRSGVASRTVSRHDVSRSRSTGRDDGLLAVKVIAQELTYSERDSCPSSPVVDGSRASRTEAMNAFLSTGF